MLKGKGVSIGIGFGNVVLLKKKERKIKKETIPKEKIEKE